MEDAKLSRAVLVAALGAKGVFDCAESLHPGMLSAYRSRMRSITLSSTSVVRFTRPVAMGSNSGHPSPKAVAYS